MTTSINTIDSKLVDAIVRQVLLRLEQENKIDKPETKTAIETTNCVHFSERVITLETLRGKIQDTKQIQVHQDAVVTPAVFDELRTRKIELTRNQTKKQAEKERETIHVVRLARHFFPTDWLKPLGNIKICSGEDYEQISQTLAESLSTGGKAICFSAQPYVAVSQLNRQKDLRAAFGRNERELSEIKATLNGNVLVMESNLKRDETQKLIQQFVG